MKFLLYAQVDQHTIGKRLGTADYSYFFLLRAFGRVLAELGEVVSLQDPAQADVIHAQCLADGEDCVLLSFMPPHKTPLGLACPTLPVFAWEYPDIPERIEENCWLDDPRHDWRYVLSRCERAITLSTHTADAVRRSLGESFPIIAIPAPIKSAAHAETQGRTPKPTQSALLQVDASVADSTRMGLNVDNMAHLDNKDDTLFDPGDEANLPKFILPRETSDLAAFRQSSLATLDEIGDPDASEPLACGWDLPPTMRIRTHLRGLVYTAVLTPSAGRKNWQDLITAFCWTFRDVPDVTLILKIAGAELTFHHQQLLMMLTKMSPLKCRVIALNGYLSNDDYAALIEATTYYVNTSLCEGLCLPLVEFLNEGVPAIAPDNTAMADYITDELAFVVASYPGVPTVWPHGDNEVNRTSYHQLDWQSLTEAYRRSYEVAHRDPALYQKMSRRAAQAMQAYCGDDVVKSRLHAFLCPNTLMPQRDPTTDRSAALAIQP